MKELNDGVDSWADAICEFDYDLSREDRALLNYKLITDAHFNIKSEANELLKIYNNNIKQ